MSGKSKCKEEILMKKFSTLALSCLAVLSMMDATAEPVFTWVDQDGVTHFSETPPEDASVESFRIELEQAPAAGPARDDDHFSVVNQVERMQKSRLENEKVRTERLQAEAEARRAATANQPRSSDNYYDSNRYYPATSFFGYRSGYQPGYQSGYRPGNKPGHRPGNRPGHRPGNKSSIRTGNNSSIRPGHTRGRPVQLPEYGGYCGYGGYGGRGGHGGHRGRTISRAQMR
jgi:hypothetical protein